MLKRLSPRERFGQLEQLRGSISLLPFWQALRVNPIDFVFRLGKRPGSKASIVWFF